MRCIFLSTTQVKIKLLSAYDLNVHLLPPMKGPILVGSHVLGEAISSATEAATAATPQG